jgi:hypothetical protein
LYAGRECARALAKDSLNIDDCTDDLDGCSEEELQRLEQRLAHIRDVYDEVGKVRNNLPGTTLSTAVLQADAWACVGAVCSSRQVTFSIA